MAAIDRYFDLMSAVWSLEVYARDESVSDQQIRVMAQSLGSQVRGKGDLVVKLPPPQTMRLFAEEEDEEQPAWAQEAQDEMEHAMELDNGCR